MAQNEWKTHGQHRSLGANLCQPSKMQGPSHHGARAGGRPSYSGKSSRSTLHASPYVAPQRPYHDPRWAFISCEQVPHACSMTSLVIKLHACFVLRTVLYVFNHFIIIDYNIKYMITSSSSTCVVLSCAFMIF